MRHQEHAHLPSQSLSSSSTQDSKTRRGVREMSSAGAGAPGRALRACPMCSLRYANVRQHLLKRHLVRNPEELRLLLSLASDRSSRRLDCALCPAVRLKRLDKHIRWSHRDVNAEGLAQMLQAARRRETIGRLAELRQSQPHPPMCSSLDCEPQQQRQQQQRRRRRGRGRRQPPAGDPLPDLDGGGPAAPGQQCRQCRRLRLQLKHALERVNVLEERLQASTAPASAVCHKRFSRATRTTEKPTKIERVLRSWLEYMGGDTAKQRENAQQKVGHARKWLQFMTQGSVANMRFDFLRNQRRLAEWVDSLAPYKVTTRRSYVTSARLFLQFVVNAQLAEVRAPLRLLKSTLFYLEGLQRRVSKKLVTHRQAVRSEKSEKVVDAADLERFCRKAAARIPEALDDLSREPSTLNRERAFGLLAGYVVCLTGHRKGVLENMLLSEVTGAATNSSREYVIKVARHKTCSTFGHAMIPLTAEEYGWFRRLLTLRPALDGSDSELLFMNSNGGPYRRLLRAFQARWREFGLPACPTFGVVRTSISTYVGRGLEPSQKAQVRRLMCHAGSTAEVFYEAEHDVREAWECRAFTSSAITMHRDKPRQRRLAAAAPAGTDLSDTDLSDAEVLRRGISES